VQQPALVILNRTARRGRGRQNRQRIENALRQHGIDHEIHETQHPGHASELVASRGAGFERVIVCGGDGTLHEALQGLDLQRHCLGLVPCGTGNDFAWMNHIPRSIEAAVERIARQEVRRIDLGTCNQVRFHNSVGVGFEGQVNYESHRIRRLHGAAVYAAAVFKTLSQRRAWPTKITWQEAGSDRTHQEDLHHADPHQEEWSGNLFLASICLGARVGGAFKMAPAALNNDGLLDLVFSPATSLWNILRLLPRTLNGSHTRSPGIQLARSQRIRLESPGGIPAHLDGEFIDPNEARLDIEVLPAALSLL